MERFKTLSEKLINFYAHRFFIAEDRLSWAVVYISGDEQSEVLSVLNIKDSDYYIDIERDKLSVKVSKDHDLIWFNMIDAWLSESDKKLHHGMEDGRIVSVNLNLGVYKDLCSYDIPFDYDIEYKPKKSVKGTLEQVYSLDFFAYRNQINKKLLKWSVAEIVDSSGSKYYLPVITIKGHKSIALYLERGCWVIDFKKKDISYDKYYLHSAKLRGHSMQFINSMGEETVCNIEMLCSMAEYQSHVEILIDKHLGISTITK